MFNSELLPRPKVLPFDECSDLEIEDCCGRVIVAPVLEGLVNDGDDEETLRQAISMLVFNSALSKEVEGSVTLNNQPGVIERQSVLFNKFVRRNEREQQEYFENLYYLMTGINYPVTRMEMLQEQWEQVRNSIPENLI